MSNYRKKNVSCFDIGEAPKNPGKRNWNWLSFLPFIFIFEQCAMNELAWMQVMLGRMGKCSELFESTCSWSEIMDNSLLYCKVKPFPEIIRSGFSSADNFSPSPLNFT